MKWICSVAMTVFALSSGIAQAEIKVTQEETQHFMSVVNDLQPQLRAATRGLSQPQRVKEFRDLARILELHSRVIGILQPQDSQTAADSFAGYLWAANQANLMNEELDLAVSLKAADEKLVLSPPSPDQPSANVEPIKNFDPANSIHVAVLTSQLLVELLGQLPEAASSIKLTQDYSHFAATHPGVAEARMLSYALIHAAVHLHKHGLEPFTSAIYASNRYSMSGMHQSILVPGTKSLGEQSDFSRLETALRSASARDIPKIIQEAKKIGSHAEGGFVQLSTDPRAKLTERDTELALLLAATYLRAVPQALRRNRETLLQSPTAASKIAHYTQMLSNCVALLGHYSNALENYQSRLLSTRAGYPFLPFSASFPLLKIAANAEQVRTDIFGVRTEILSVGGQINQLNRITNTGMPRTPAGEPCSWEFIDTMLGLAPEP